jgi:hypothetical protein
MTQCKRAAQLISLSLEVPLNWRQRLALSIHLLGCDLCRRFRRQMRLMQLAGPQAGDPDNSPGGENIVLSGAARERIRRVLLEQNNGGSG